MTETATAVVAEPAAKRIVRVRLARKGCEHFCFLGALADFGGSLLHIEWAVFLIAGKLAFVVGALGVYLLHIEETGAHPPGA